MFPIFLSYIAAFSEIGGSWLLIIGLATRFGALAIVGTISVAIYHALVTAGFNIFLLDPETENKSKISSFFPNLFN